MLFPAVYVKKVFSLALDLPLENFGDSCACFGPGLLHLVPYFLFLYQSRLLPFGTVFDAISSNIDAVLLIDPSANVFIFYLSFKTLASLIKTD